MDILFMVEKKNTFLSFLISTPPNLYTLLLSFLRMPELNIPGDRLVQIEGTPARVKYKDIFDMKGFYETLYWWINERGWKDAIDYEIFVDHFETYYGERISLNGMKEIWIQWRFFKKPSQAPFLAYYLDLDWHVIGLENTEVIRGGHKIKTNKGEIEVSIRAFIDKQYQGEFQKQSILKDIEKLFTSRIYKKELEKRKKELYQEVYVLQNFLKQWFKLKRYLPYEEVKSFYPSTAYPSHLKEG